MHLLDHKAPLIASLAAEAQLTPIVARPLLVLFARQAILALGLCTAKLAFRGHFQPKSPRIASLAPWGAWHPLNQRVLQHVYAWMALQCMRQIQPT
jgi:hypothetical protein